MKIKMIQIIQKQQLLKLLSTALCYVVVHFNHTKRFKQYTMMKTRFLACRSRQASIVLEWYFRFEVSLLSFYACERDGPIRVSGGSDIIT